MAAKKSNTKLQMNTNSNRIAHALIYAFLEWILIALLLMNSLFSYLIVKFAGYFGLQNPCFWCSRLDNLFEPGEKYSRFQDLVCEAHSKEISNLGFCFNHRKLVDFRDMCKDCFCSSFPMLNRRSNVEKENFRACRCCNERFKTEIDPAFYVYEPSWEAWEQPQMKNLNVDVTIGELSDRNRSKNDEEKREIQMVSDFNEKASTCSVCELGFEEEKDEFLAEEDREFIENQKSSASMDEKLESSAQHLEFYIGQEDCRLIPIKTTRFLPMQVENDRNKEGEDNYFGDLVFDFLQPVVETWQSSVEAIEVIPSHGRAVELNIPSHDSNHDHQGFKIDTEHENAEINDLETEGEEKVLKILFPLNRNESTAEESFDESVLSEIDSYDGIVSIERLKSALRADRTAINALYAELELERSASAVAANQTMAMINRLQEEKATMQMEALQYQRIAEEQSEYDQEALQILNDLAMKREKENQELEKELDFYRRKVREFEAREKTMIRRNKKEEIGKISCDGRPMKAKNERKDNCDRRYENGESKTRKTPVDEVLCMEESLSGFQEERISMIERLKLLEGKLFFSSYGEEIPGSIGRSKGHDNGHHKDRKIMNSKPKRLLPLFDKTVEEEEEEVKNEEEEYKKVAIEEEVADAHERLEALEEDREFFKHCMNCLKKGDKGLEILQEILQNLRDLRAVNLRVQGPDACLKNMQIC